jgi:hypothetical protein
MSLTFVFVERKKERKKKERKVCSKLEYLSQYGDWLWPGLLAFDSRQGIIFSLLSFL